MNFFNEIQLSSFQAEAIARGLFAVAQGRKWIPRFNFSRNISPSYGQGRDRIANILSAGYLIKVSRHVSLSANGNYSWSRDPVDPTLNYSSQSYGAALRTRIIAKNPV